MYCVKCLMCFPLKFKLLCNVRILMSWESHYSQQILTPHYFLTHFRGVISHYLLGEQVIIFHLIMNGGVIFLWCVVTGVAIIRCYNRLKLSILPHILCCKYIDADFICKKDLKLTYFKPKLLLLPLDKVSTFFNFLLINTATNLVSEHFYSNL